MENSRIDQYRAALRAKRSELMAGLNRRDGLAAESAPDIFDEIQLALDRALVIESLDRNSGVLRSVSAALERTQDGSYGQCLNCEEDISPKRLAAIPWAEFCIKCQEQADREGHGRYEEEILSAA